MALLNQYTRCTVQN